MSLAPKDLETAVGKLRGLKETMPGKSPDFYGLAGHLAQEWGGRQQSLWPGDYYKAAQAYTTSNKLPPTTESMVDLARAAFADPFRSDVTRFLYTRSSQFSHRGLGPSTIRVRDGT